MIEHRVDHGRGVARLDLAGGERAGVEHVADRLVAAVERPDQPDAVEGGIDRARRRDHVVGRDVERRVPVEDVGQLVKREIVLVQRVRRIHGAARRGHAEHERRQRDRRAERVVGSRQLDQAGAQRILDPRVGAGVEVAARAGHAVAADRDVPEQALPSTTAHFGSFTMPVRSGSLGNGCWAASGDAARRPRSGATMAAVVVQGREAPGNPPLM